MTKIFGVVRFNWMQKAKNMQRHTSDLSASCII